MQKEIIPSKSEYEKLLEEIRELQARIVELTALRDDLLYRVCPSLRAVYEEKIGCIERELLAAKLYLKEKQRTLEILQAQLNRQEIVSVEAAEEKAGEEFRQHEEDLKKKAKEAEQSREKWQKSRWRQHEEENKDRECKDRECSDREYTDSTGSGPDINWERHDGEGDDNFENKEDSETGSSDGAESGGSSDSDASGEEDRNIGSSGRKPRNTVEALKRLYRKIVKRLHPDVHPDLTEREKEFFNKAVTAYEEGDLDKMQEIWEELESGRDAGERFSDTPEDLEKLRAMLKGLRERVRDLSREISRIRSQYPYTMKEFLEDEEAVEERRRELEKQLHDIRDANAKLDEFIEQVRRKVKDPWNN